MEETLYVKYNASRNPRYQTETRIVREKRQDYAIKSPLREEARDHICSLPKKYEWSKKIYDKIDFLPVELNDGRARYPVLKGKSLDDILQEHLGTLEECISFVMGIINQYYRVRSEAAGEFVPTEKWTEIFGNDLNTKITGECICPANLDMIFDNIIMVNENTPVAYDYEWTFNISVPKNYIIYRVLSHIYDKYFKIISAWIDYPEFAEKFGIKPEEMKLFKEMENRFLCHIYNDGEQVIVNDSLYPRTIKEHAVKDDIVLAEQVLPSVRQDFKNVESEKNKLIVKLDQQTRQTDEKIKALQSQTQALQSQIQQMKQSKSWKMTKPLRLAGKAYRKIKREGLINAVRNVLSKRKLKQNGYHLKRSEGELRRERGQAFSNPVKISVVTPLYCTPLPFLREMIESVIAQTYTNWELCLIDFSPKEDSSVEQVVGEYTAQDQRILYKRSEKNIGIAENTNLCADMATGEYIAVLDHDDVLHPSAFYEVMKAIDQGADFIYTDEIKFQETIDHPEHPNFKPDFTREQLQTQNFICHLNVYKKSLFEKGGRYRSGFNGSQDHDLVLRLTEQAEHIVHIPQVLYYWRVHPNSVAENIGAKPYATLSGIKAVNESYQRQGLPYQVESIRDNIPTYRIIPKQHIDGTISIVIWNVLNADDLRTTISSLKKNLDRKVNLTVSVSDDKISDEEIQKASAGLQLISLNINRTQTNSPSIRSLKESADQEGTEYIWLLLSGVEIESEHALSELLALCSISEVAAVDSQLYAEDENKKTFWSAGLYIAPNESPIIRLRAYGAPDSFEGTEADFIHVRAVSCVSGICTMVRTDALEGDCRTITEWSLEQPRRKRNNVITPFVHGICKEELLEQVKPQLENIQVKEIPEREPYFSNQILKNHLE
jgi:glycosyltransferase involved in cell wall biosynthesis